MSKQKEYKPLKGKCPRCQAEIEARKPPRYEVWDSYCACPHCKGLLYKIATHWVVKLYVHPIVPDAE